jgi:hypothetical protein
MARHSMRRVARAGLLALGLAAAGPTAVAQESSTASEWIAEGHVRATDPRAGRVLQEGAAHAATFGALLDAIERSDVRVYVETGDFERPGALYFAGATGDSRFLRVRLRAPGQRVMDMVPWLAHELQHAVEIASAPDVRDERRVLGLYRSIGMTGGSACETLAAQRVWARVRDEMAR